MENLKYLEKIKNTGFRDYIASQNGDMTDRIGLALEIIAEELIKLNDSLNHITTVLENIEKNKEGDIYL